MKAGHAVLSLEMKVKFLYTDSAIFAYFKYEKEQRSCKGEV